MVIAKARVPDRPSVKARNEPEAAAPVVEEWRSIQNAVGRNPAFPQVAKVTQEAGDAFDLAIKVVQSSGCGEKQGHWWLALAAARAAQD